MQSAKALIAVLPALIIVFYMARFAFANIIDPKQIDRWRNVYLAVTIAGFLAPNFWAALTAVAFLVVVLGQRESFRPALYLVLIFALPPMQRFLPGFAGVSNFILMSVPTVLAITVLVPLLFNGQRMKKFAAGGGMTDVFFVLFLLLNCVLAFRDTSITDGIRIVITTLLVAAPPYFVMSRWTQSLNDVKILSVALVIPLLALSAIGIQELALGWHFYADIFPNWSGFHGAYSLRSGLLRSYGSFIAPISFGLFLMVGLTVSLALLSSDVKKNLGRLGVVGFCLGLLTSLSRGPWIGAVIAVGLFVISGPKALASTIRLGVVGLFGVAILLMTPYGGLIIDLIPGIGGAASDTIEYRQRLLQVGWNVVLANPLFGMEYEKANAAMESLRQGQGIIDIVNSYLGIALETGLVGLSLFVGIHFSALYSAWRSIGRARLVSEELSTYCRAYFSAHLGILLVLATTSSIGQTKQIYWVVAGICVALTRITNSALANASKTPPTTPPAEDDRHPEMNNEVSPLDGVKPADVPRHLRQYVKK